MNASLAGRSCPAFGATARADARFCPQCGASLVDALGRYQWIISVPMVHNRFILYDLAKVLFWSAVVIAVLMLLILGIFGDDHDFLRGYLKIMQIFGFILAGFAVLALAIMLVFFGNRYRIGFIVDGNGIGWFSAMARTKWAARAAVAGGLIAGEPGLLGAGLLGQASEKGKIEWGDIRRLKLYPALGVISVMNSWRVVVRLYCNPEIYPLLPSGPVPPAG